MKMIRSAGRVIFVTALISSLSGCYYTAHSYNHGKLLDPGNALFTLGVGGTVQTTEVYDYDYSSYSSRIESDTGASTRVYYDFYDTIPKLWRSVSLGYQLGVHDRFPFGGGIEIGLMLEGSYYRSSDLNSNYIPTLDFDVRLGFKDHEMGQALYQHNVELGWTTGAWIDNGLFIGYAGGWEFEHFIPYGGIRAVLMPTNILENSSFMEFEETDLRTQKANLRLAAGTTLKLRKLKFLPDYITPEFTFTGPYGSQFERFNGNFHVGFRWTNGL